MKRWAAILGTGLLLALLVLWIEFPFRVNLYHTLMKLRGPVPSSGRVVIVSFAPAALDAGRGVGREGYESQLRLLLDALERRPPAAVHLDFDSPAGQTPRSYPLFAETGGVRAGVLPTSLPLVRSPDSIDPYTLRAAPDPVITDAVHPDLLRAVAPAELARLAEAPTEVVNVVGPPGSFPRFEIRELLASPEKLAQLAGKIVLVSPPPGMGRPRSGYLPFFPRRGSPRFEGTEIHANILDTIVGRTGIRPFPGAAAVAITVGVSVLTVSLLFGTSPILGLLAVVLLIVLLFITALGALGAHRYLEIHGALSAIAVAYYFLVPYRLIVEYKGRWKYQQESKLRAEVETLKDNFMSLVSHNLKSPIARLTGTVETLLADRDAGPEKRETELRNILKAADDLNRFVTRILNLAQVERPEYQVHTASRDLNALVEKAVEGQRMAADERGIRLAAKLEPLFPVQVDGELIRESVSNLVENAVKYTPAGGRIDVSTAEEGDWVKVRVDDTGPGIKAEDAERIFAKFYRGVDVKNKGIRGSGLGLYLVKYFVELHGGSVAFENRPEGGSRFTISLLRK
jgi:signal transduction histidine kinase